MTQQTAAEEDKASRKKNRPKPQSAPAAGPETPARPMAQHILQLPLAAVHPSPHNRRIADDDPTLASLADSIQRYGLNSPITVYPLAGTDGDAPKYEIIDGERRWRACRKLDMAFIPAIEFPVDERTAHAMRLIANKERQDLTPVEEGEGVAALLDLCGDDVSEVAARLGRGESWVRRRMRLSYLSDAWRAELAKENTEYEHIRNSVEKMEEVAQLPVSEQDALLDHGTLRYAETTREIRDEIREHLRRLDARPWDDAFENSVAESQQCARCANRSDRREDLFSALGDGEDEEDAGAAMCLDSSCWRTKQIGWLMGRLAEANCEASRRGLKAPAVFVIEGRGDRDNIEGLNAASGGLVKNDYWKKLNEENYDDIDLEYGPPVAAVIANGARIGTIIIVRFLEESDDDDDDGENAEDPEERERLRAEEEAKRIHRRAFCMAFERVLPKKCPVDDDRLMQLVMWYGYSSTEMYKFNRPLVPASEKNPRARLWTFVKKKMVDFLGYSSIDVSDVDRTAICAYLGLNVEMMKSEVLQAKGKIYAEQTAGADADAADETDADDDSE